MGRLTRDGTAEIVSRDQILRHERGQGNFHFPCSADHESVGTGPVTYIYTYIYIHRRFTYIHTLSLEEESDEAEHRSKNATQV